MDYGKAALVLARAQTQFPTLKSYGATGNGTSDDTSPFANAPAGVTIVSPGAYKISSNILPNGKIFNGWGAQNASVNGSLVYSSVSYGFDSLTREALPPAPTGTPSASGGALAAGTRYAVVVAQDSAGSIHTLTLESAGVATTGSTSSIAWTWPAFAGAVSYLIYTGTAAGGENVYFASATNSFTQTTDAGTAGTVPSLFTYSARNAGFGTHALSQTTYGFQNAAFGWGAGQQITTGSQNTLLGMAAGNALTTGVSNVAVGTSALLNLTTGGNNVAIGRAAGLAATTANYNVLIGRDTAEAKQTGDADTLVGYEALWTATATGGYNTGIGWRTFFSATGTFGTQNTTVGSESSYNLTTGNNNTAIGQRALFSGTTVSDTVAIGQQALYNLTTGARNTGLGTRVAGYTGGLTTGNDNVLIGWQAYYGGSGTANVIIGSQTVGQGSAATGSSNVVVGEASGVAMTAGGQNTIIGGSAGTTLTTGNGNVLIGYNAQAPAAGNNGQIVIAANGSNIVTYDGSANFNINATSTIASGGLLSKGTGGVGYTTGAGGTVTQATSRTTGVTINKPAGQITLFSAAGSATPASFTVTNSTVAAVDVVHLSQASGTNPYGAMVTAVAAGSFTVTFWALSGTATDAPVFNFAVIKGSPN